MNEKAEKLGLPSTEPWNNSDISLIRFGEYYIATVETVRGWAWALYMGSGAGNLIGVSSDIYEDEGHALDALFKWLNN